MGSREVPHMMDGLLEPFALLNATAQVGGPSSCEGNGYLDATGADREIFMACCSEGVEGITICRALCHRMRVSRWRCNLPMTRTVGDAALMLQRIAGRDTADPTTVDKPVPDFTAHLEDGQRVCG